MPACKMSLHCPYDKLKLFEQVMPMAAANGVQIVGDHLMGTVNVSLSLGRLIANYIVQGDIITVTILKKPFLMPCALIETICKNYLASLRGS